MEWDSLTKICFTYILLLYPYIIFFLCLISIPVFNKRMLFKQRLRSHRDFCSGWVEVSIGWKNDEYFKNSYARSYFPLMIHRPTRS